MTQPSFVSASSKTTPAANTTSSSNIAASKISSEVAPAPTPTLFASSASTSSSTSSLPPPQLPLSFLSLPSDTPRTIPSTTTTPAATFNTSNADTSSSSSNSNSTTSTTTTTTYSNTATRTAKFRKTSYIVNETNYDSNQRHHHRNHLNQPPEPYHHHHHYQHPQQHQHHSHRYQQYSSSNNKFYRKSCAVRTSMENTYGCSVGAVASVPVSGATAAAAALAGTDTDNNCPGVITEAGVDIGVHHSSSTLSTYERTGKSLHYNPKMAVAREFVMCALTTYCSQRDIGSPPACLDAVGGTGLAGIQWKKYLGKKAHVTITDRNNLDLLEANCYRNSLLPKELSVDCSRSPGLPLPHQLIDEVFVQQISANVIMHLEAFDFIYIDAHGSCVSYLDAAFTNIRNNGLLCIVSTDLSALFAKTRHVAMRNYGANVIKNEYMKEAAVRVVIGAAARSAAKCSKGIQVMFGVCIEPFVLVIIKVQRGPYYADMCSLKVRPLIHCQMCEERTFCPEMRASVENLYSLLPCECQSETPGKTAVKLGPMWCDNIFNTKFIEQMITIAGEMKLSEHSTLAQLCSILNESVCSSSPVDSSSPSKYYQSSYTSSSSSSPSRSVSFPSLSAQQHNERSALKSLKHKSSSASSASSLSSSSVCTPLSMTVSGNPASNDINTNGNNNGTTTTTTTTTTTSTTTTTTAAATLVDVGPVISKNSTMGNGGGDGDVVDVNTNEMTTNMKGAVSVTIVSTSSDPQGNLKMDFTVDKSLRNCRSLSNEPPIKRICLPDPDPNPGLAMPPFFYNIHKRKFKGVFLPKLSKMVHLLQSEGFRASRTIFDTYGIRTNASQKEIYRTLLKYCKQEL